MKTITTNFLRLAAILSLAIVLSGCALGGRLNPTPTPERPQTGQSQPAAASATPLSQLSSPTATGAASSTQGADLLKMINTLDAANQAGDPLDNLP